MWPRAVKSWHNVAKIGLMLPKMEKLSNKAIIDMISRSNIDLSINFFDLVNNSSMQHLVLQPIYLDRRGK